MRKLRDCACGCGGQTRYTYLRGHWPRACRDGDGNKLCYECGILKPETSEFFPRCAGRATGLAAYCKPCHVKRGRENLAKRFAENPELFRAKWRNRAKAARKADPKKFAAMARKSRQKLRAEMVLAYGGKCSCCGETHLEFLTLEHTNGDGAAHRAAISTGGGNAIWKDLQRRGWPSIGFTILCWNCHMATAWGHACPHKTILELT